MTVIFPLMIKKEFSFEDSGYDPITEPVVQSLPFPLEEGSSTEDASVIIYGFVCPGLRKDLEQELVINTLTVLFADDSSGLQQAFQEALPYGTFESHIVTMGPEDAVTFIAKMSIPKMRKYSGKLWIKRLPMWLKMDFLQNRWTP